MKPHSTALIEEVSVNVLRAIGSSLAWQFIEKFSVGFFQQSVERDFRHRSLMCKYDCIDSHCDGLLHEIHINFLV